MRENKQFEKYLIKRNAKDYLSLEEFLNHYSIKINFFISLMDQSQTSYRNLEDYISKIQPSEWLSYCFRWSDADADIAYVRRTWYELKSEWYKASVYFKNNYPDICITFFKPLSDAPKLRLIFEGD